MEMKKKKHIRRMTFYGYFKACMKRHEEMYGQINEDSIVDLPNRNSEEVASELWAEIVYRFYTKQIWN